MSEEKETEREKIQRFKKLLEMLEEAELPSEDNMPEYEVKVRELPEVFSGEEQKEVLEKIVGFLNSMTRKYISELDVEVQKEKIKVLDRMLQKLNKQRMLTPIDIALSDPVEREIILALMGALSVIGEKRAFELRFTVKYKENGKKGLDIEALFFDKNGQRLPIEKFDVIQGDHEGQADNVSE